MPVSRPHRLPEGRRAIVVGIPANNESDRIADSLTSVLASANQLSSHVEVVVVVACDSCSDDTASVAQTIAETDDRLHVLSGSWGSAGWARRVAIGHGLSLVKTRHQPARVWIASTDADTYVPETWLAQHLALAGVGHDAVAGIVDLYEDADLTSLVRMAFDTTYEVGPHGHSHVHGANMGICADAYRMVGGFVDVHVAEDHAMWNALRAAGYDCASVPHLRVETSARPRGRAIGGFADTLRELVDRVEHTLAESAQSHILLSEPIAGA